MVNQYNDFNKFLANPKGMGQGSKSRVTKTISLGFGYIIYEFISVDIWKDYQKMYLKMHC